MTPWAAQALVERADRAARRTLDCLQALGLKADGSAVERERRRMARAWGRCRERWEERALHWAQEGQHLSPFHIDFGVARECLADAQRQAAYCYERGRAWDVESS